jgi:hypothetical protein
MSLWDIITDKQNQELRDNFKKVFPRPQIKLTGQLIAPPLTSNYSVVGQAFDYLLRFTLEFRNKEKIKSNESWVADNSYEMLYKFESGANSKIIRVGNHKDIEKNRKKFLIMLKAEYLNAKANYKEYLADGILSDDLIKSALYLSRLDTYYRAGIIDQNIGNENDDDINDLRQLISIIKDEHFKVENNCFINPTFGFGSKLVGGADADLIIDDTLIDIKVSKKLAIDRSHLNQAIGYYILSLIGGINGDESLNPIKNIGLYFARHGVLWKTSLSNIADEKTFSEFKDWFVNYIEVKVRGQIGWLEENKKIASQRSI